MNAAILKIKIFKYQINIKMDDNDVNINNIMSKIKIMIIFIVEHGYRNK